VPAQEWVLLGSNFLQELLVPLWLLLLMSKKAHQAFVPGLEGAHGKEQWCYAAVSVADAKTTCTF